MTNATLTVVSVNGNLVAAIGGPHNKIGRAAIRTANGADTVQTVWISDTSSQLGWPSWAGSDLHGPWPAIGQTHVEGDWRATRREHMHMEV
jgi:hypothetical protein